jgi:hypothetical protein
MLLLVKLVHTGIWFLMSAAVLYVFYSGVTDQINMFTWVAIILVSVEGFALLLNRWTCPLHKVSSRIAPEGEAVHDLFIPKWVLFKYYKAIFALIYFVGLFLVIRG